MGRADVGLEVAFFTRAFCVDLGFAGALYAPALHTSSRLAMMRVCVTDTPQDDTNRQCKILFNVINLCVRALDTGARCGHTLSTLQFPLFVQ